MSATRLLAEYVSDSSFEDLPIEVVRESKRAILNYLGVALGASRHEAVRILKAATDEMGGHPQATILGSQSKASVLQAATVNGAMSHVFDYDDTHMDTIIHPTGPVMSAALALSEWKGLSGKDLIASVATGAEVELRIGLAVYPAHYDVGWHITATVGTFGAAAGSGWLLKLDAGRLAHAFGLAGTQAAGLREMFGSMAKALHVGNAATNGLWSALLAEKGFTASTQVLEAKRGFCSVLSSEYDLSKATDGLGSRYVFLENALKPYACGVVTHPTIDGVRRLRERYHLTEDDVVEIETRVHPLVLELTGKKAPSTGLEGKFSIYYCAAIALVEGNARESQFADEKTRWPQVVALRDRVRAIVEPGIGEGQAVVTIRTADGRELVERVEAATGTPENPLPDEELMGKFMDLVLPVLPRDRAEQLAEAVWNLETVQDVSRLAELSGMSTVRGTIHTDDPRGTHLLAAYLPSEGIVLLQVPAGHRDNEIGVAPALLRGIDLRGKIVAADAMHTQREFSAEILAAGGEYLFLVKDNQPTLRGEIELLFAEDRTVEGGEVVHDFKTTRQVNKGHGRREVRQITVSDELKGYCDWPGLEQVFRLERQRIEIKTGEIEQEVVYGLTSLTPTQASPSRITRTHSPGVPSGVLTSVQEALRWGYRMKR